MHDRPTLKAREHRGVDLLADRLVPAQDHAAPWAAQGLVRGGGDDIGMGQRAGVDAARHQPRKVRHVDEQIRAHLVADGAEPLEIDEAWIGRARSEEHTSELQSLMRISYAVFCLKNKKKSIR